MLLNLQFSVQCFVDHCLSSWPMHCLSYFDLQLLYTSLVSKIYSFCLPLWYLRFTASVYPFGILDLQLLFTPLVSQIYGFCLPLWYLQANLGDHDAFQEKLSSGMLKVKNIAFIMTFYVMFDHALDVQDQINRERTRTIRSLICYHPSNKYVNI